MAATARDTLKQVNSAGRIECTIDRSVIWHALTPQMFRLGVLHSALEETLRVEAPITDEASALEYAGYMPRVIEGRASNIKVTHPDDMRFLRNQLLDRQKNGSR